jgi:hypothetical protein
MRHPFQTLEQNTVLSSDNSKSVTQMEYLKVSLNIRTTSLAPQSKAFWKVKAKWQVQSMKL